MAREGMGVERARSGLDGVRPAGAESPSVRQALELDSREPHLLANLGGVLLVAGDLQGALDMLRAAVADTPGDTVALLQLARAQRASGDLANAARSLGRTYCHAEKDGDEAMMRVADSEQADLAHELNKRS